MYFKYKKYISLAIKVLNPVLYSFSLGSDKVIKKFYVGLNILDKITEITSQGNYELPELPEESFGPTKFFGEDKYDN